jgi:hypothetical protein
MKVKYWLIMLALVFLAQACVVAPAPPEYRGGSYRQGPPPHAPAHGYRAKHRYYYYPEVSVYFDLDRRVYFYLDRGWQVATRLPRDLRLGLYGPVTIEMDLDKPYRRYDEHRRKYPPHRGKKKKHKRW